MTLEDKIKAEMAAEAQAIAHRAAVEAAKQRIRERAAWPWWKKLLSKFIKEK